MGWQEVWSCKVGLFDVALDPDKEHIEKYLVFGKKLTELI